MHHRLLITWRARTRKHSSGSEKRWRGKTAKAAISCLLLPMHQLPDRTTARILGYGSGGNRCGDWWLCGAGERYALEDGATHTLSLGSLNPVCRSVIRPPRACLLSIYNHPAALLSHLQLLATALGSGSTHHDASVEDLARVSSSHEFRLNILNRPTFGFLAITDMGNTPSRMGDRHQEEQHQHHTMAERLNERKQSVSCASCL